MSLVYGEIFRSKQCSFLTSPWKSHPHRVVLIYILLTFKCVCLVQISPESRAHNQLLPQEYLMGISQAPLRANLGSTDLILPVHSGPLPVFCISWPNGITLHPLGQVLIPLLPSVPCSNCQSPSHFPISQACLFPSPQRCVVQGDWVCAYLKLTYIL